MKKGLLILHIIVFACVKEVTDLPQIIDEIPLEPNPITNVLDLSGTPCDNGMAEIYPCLGYDLLSRISLETFGSKSANDNWGWVDPESGKEYVLSGLDDGTAFIDISDPKDPLVLGKLPTSTLNSPWRDIKVYDNHALIVSEAPGHGLQVFDLNRLRTVDEYQIFTSDFVLNDFGNAHNLWINQESGYAYVFGSELYKGGPVFININNPKTPTIEGGYAQDSYMHNAQIVIYDGPDTQYKDHEILFGSNSDGGINNQIIILDVTDKSNPIRINSITYPNDGYSHQGILSDDHRYFFHGDELDELQYGSKSHTRIFNFTSLSNPEQYFSYFGETNAIDHDAYVKGDKLYLSNYTAGMRVLDISQVHNKNVTEIGFFDTYPEDNNPKFNGVWNMYPFFESGVIAINDIDSGLFLVKAPD